ncbi:MAG TPA: ELM1/GtrOC1 family putative glycosyltransferase, partial [Methylomirabilota bacterium]|nr:ELM1/GtrOC1 family putative glycosyltransferase [Methylomirabilota bacterium]
MADTPDRRDPLVWVLLADRAGGNGQLLSLAEALGWPSERKTIAYNAANRLPNLLLGASLAGVQSGASSALAPPWPDLVLAASRRSVPVARWIRARSGGRTKLVHLLHAMAPLDLFDLVITTPQYRLPARPNVLHLAAPLNRVAAATLRDAAAGWSPRLAHLSRPWVALLVGGDSATYRFDAAVARRLAQTANAAVAQGGKLLVSTSPRTAPAAADALAGALAPASFVYRWRPGDADNPYHAFLALADR